MLGVCVLFGYSIRTAREWLHEDGPPLPDWGLFSGLLLDAVRAWMLYACWGLVFDVLALLPKSVMLAGQAGVFASGVMFVGLFAVSALLLPLALLMVAADRFRESFNPRAHLRRIRRNPMVVLKAGTLFFAVSVAQGIATSFALRPVVAFATGDAGEAFEALPAILLIAPVLSWSLTVSGATVGHLGRHLGVRPG